MADISVGLRLVSDFNIEVFGRYLQNDPGFPACNVEAAPFGQVFQVLMGTEPVVDDGIGVVWTRPEGVVEGFNAALRFEPVDPAVVLAQAEEFARAIVRWAEQQRYVLVASWAFPADHRGFGMLDWRGELGLRNLLARANLRLAECLAGTTNVFMLDSEAWLRAGGPRPAARRTWFAGKVPFANKVFQEAVLDIKAALRGILGKSIKMIVVDLDNTLWGGVVGETGWEGITLGGHSLQGEAFVALQQALKSYANRGVQLGIVSRNDEQVALAAIDNHPAMVLRRADFAGWRINWRDKAANLADLVREVSIGLEDVVFLDDSPMERGRIMEALPQVLVPEWPEDPAQSVAALHGLRLFDLPTISAEDRERVRMYAAERERRSTLEKVGSVDEWFKTMEIRVLAADLSPATIPRAVQLFNKTNQLNLSTRRLSESELVAWASQPNHRLWTISVADRFGDSGLSGIVSIVQINDVAQIVDFILSCRVMGRKVEEAMIYIAAREARAAGATTVFARYCPTERNGPCRQFLTRSGLEESEPDLFVLRAGQDCPLPECIRLESPSLECIGLKDPWDDVRPAADALP